MVFGKTSLIKQRQLSSFVEHIILIGLLGTIMLPQIHIGIGISLITPMSFILIRVLLLNYRYVSINKFVIIYSCILFVMFCAIVNSYLVLNIEETYRDYMELFRYMQILPYLLVINLINYETFNKKLKIYMMVSVLFILLIIFLEVTNIANIAYYIGMVYAGSLHTADMLNATRRIIATGSDPNVGALILTFFILYFATRDRLDIAKKIVLILLFSSLLLTQSRTLLIGLVTSYIIYILLISKYHLVVKAIFILGTLFSVILFINIFNLNYIILGFQMALEGENHSLNVRLMNAAMGYERFLTSPYLGWGPSKAIFSTIIDSEYVLIMQRYGLVGIGMYLILLGSIFHFSYKLLNISENAVWLFLFTIVGLFMMLTNNFFSGYQTNSMIFLLLILNLSLVKNLKENNAN